MKKIIFILALFVSFVANAQYTPPSGYTNINSRYDWLAGVFRALGLPAGGNAAFTTGQAVRAGAVYYDSTGTDSGFYVYTGTYWRNHSVSSSGNNTNAGAFYRWLKTGTQEIKTFAPGYGILIDSTTNTDALTARLDSATVFPQIRASIPNAAVAEVSKDFTLSNDSLYNTNWVNVVDYGADPTGVSNAVTAFSNAISTGKNVFVPVGTFLITGSTGATPLIALQAGQSIFGTGVNSIIKTTTNARILDITTNCVVQNLKFLGSGNNSTSAQYQSGIYAAGTDATGWVIQNCTFEKLGGSTAIDGGGIIVEQIGASFTEGGRITNCRFVDIYYGIALDTRAEYVNISNVKISDANTGIYFASGNVNISNADVQDCVTGLKAFGGTNNGHCVVSNSTFNHNTNSLDIEDVTGGHTFQGVMFYVGNVSIEGSEGVKFIGCDFSTGTATLTSNANLSRVGCRWLTMTTSLVSGEDFAVSGSVRNGSTPNYFINQQTADTSKFAGPVIFSPLAGSGSGYVAVDNNGQISWGTGSGGGGGDVFKVGTPADNQIGVWTGDGTLEGNNNLSWNGTLMTLNGTSAASTAEELLRATVSDDANSFLSIRNSTTANNTFSPLFIGETGTSTTQSPMVFIGQVTAGTESGTTPMMIFDSRRTSAAATTRPLFDFRNFGTSRMLMTATGRVGIGTTGPVTLLQAEVSDATTNSIVYPMTISHTTSATAAVGGGVGMQYYTENASGTMRVTGSTTNPMTDATNATEDADFIINLIRAGTLTEGFRVTSVGGITVNGSAGTAGQVLTSGGTGAASTWTNKATLTKNATIENPTASENIGMFRTPVAITITNTHAVLVGSSTPSVTYNIAFGTDITALTNVYTAGQTVTSTTTGTAASGVNDATIPADSWIRITTSAQSGTVGQISLSITYTED